MFCPDKTDGVGKIGRSEREKISIPIGMERKKFIE